MFHNPFPVLGKVFAILAAADSAVPLVSSVIFTQVYTATIDSYPAAIYWVTVTSQALVFLFILYVTQNFENYDHILFSFMVHILSLSSVQICSHLYEEHTGI